MPEVTGVPIVMESCLTGGAVRRTLACSLTINKTTRKRPITGRVAAVISPGGKKIGSDVKHVMVRALRMRRFRIVPVGLTAYFAGSGDGVFGVIHDLWIPISRFFRIGKRWIMVVEAERLSVLVRNGFLAVLGGVLMALAFPKPSIWPAAWVCLVPVLIAVERCGWRWTAVWSWLFGLTGFMLDLAWVRRTMIDYGGLSECVSIIVLFLLAAYCALYPAVAVTLSRELYRHGQWSTMAVLPFLWVASEYLRAHLITGFPWNAIGQSQVYVPLLLQNADWGSFYGLSFLVVAGNTALYELFRDRKRGRSAAILTVILLLSALGYGFHRLRNDPESMGKTVTIGIVQGNIDQRIKWEPGNAERILNTYIRLSRMLLKAHPHALIWPESALTFYARYAWRYETADGGSLGERLHRLVLDADAPLLAGTLDRIGNNIYNAVCMIPPDGLESFYYKEHLVPFGEYVPLHKVLFFVNRMVNGSIGDFTPGTSDKPLVYDGLSFGVTICYEQIFPELVRRRVQGGASIVCNVTNDAWFGRSAAAEQHFNASRFRAVETRRPVVRAANTGISGAVDSRGRIIVVTKLFEPAAFTVTVHLSKEISPYLKYGDVFPVTCIIVSVLYLVGTAVRSVRYRRKRRRFA